MAVTGRYRFSSDAAAKSRLTPMIAEVPRCDDVSASIGEPQPRRRGVR
jgi:hypothetical protein